MTRGRGSGGRIAGLLVLIGCLGAFGFTFWLGFLTGRHWGGGLPSPIRWARPTAGSPSAAPPTGDDDAHDPDGSPRARGSIPKLTFYHELTAPLASPPKLKPRSEAPKAKAEAVDEAPPRPAPSMEPPRLDRAGPTDKPASSLPLIDSAAAARPQAAAPGGYTVQVGAYRTRGLADALKDKLVAKGIGAYVSEAETLAGTRYRVRVGAYPTKDIAQEAAVRLATETQVGAYVTTR